MVTLTEREISLAPHLARADEGDRYGHGPEGVRTILSSEQTGGAFSMLEATIDAPAYGPPYHVHTMEDETFHVLEGSLVLIVDGQRLILNPGDVAFAPRGIPHRFESGPQGVRVTIMSTGSNFERFLPRFCAAATAGEMHRVPAIAAEHGISFLPQE